MFLLCSIIVTNCNNLGCTCNTSLWEARLTSRTMQITLSVFYMVSFFRILTFPCQILSVLGKESFKVLGFFGFCFVCLFKAVQHFSKTDCIQINSAGLLEEIRVQRRYQNRWGSVFNIGLVSARNSILFVQTLCGPTYN